MFPARREEDGWCAQCAKFPDCCVKSSAVQPSEDCVGKIPTFWDSGRSSRFPLRQTCFPIFSSSNIDACCPILNSSAVNFSAYDTPGLSASGMTMTFFQSEVTNPSLPSCEIQMLKFVVTMSGNKACAASAVFSPSQTTIVASCWPRISGSLYNGLGVEPGKLPAGTVRCLAPRKRTVFFFLCSSAGYEVEPKDVADHCPSRSK